jgi:hypothetical protein
MVLFLLLISQCVAKSVVREWHELMMFVTHEASADPPVQAVSVFSLPCCFPALFLTNFLSVSPLFVMCKERFLSLVSGDVGYMASVQSAYWCEGGGDLRQ